MNPILNRKGSIWTLGAMLAAFAGSSATAYAVDPKITLTPSMLTNEIVRGDVGLLVDEQAISGNPAAGTSGSPTTVWTQSIGYDNGNWYFPASAIIDLGQTYNITNVSLYDMNNSGNIVIARGTPFNWTTVYTQTLDWYNSWRVQPTNFQTRYLRVTVVDGAATLGEIVLNGTPIGGTQPTPTPLPPVTRQRPTMEGFIGANAFNDDPVDKLTAVGFIREYHNWDWNPEQGAMFPSNRNYWNSTPSGFAFDNFYMAAKNAGLQVSPSIQDSTVNVLGPGVDLAHKPIAVGANPESPASYIQHADFMFQYAARYGNTSVAENLLKVNPDIEVPATNTKLINWYENWNEENKWWKDRAGYFTPFEMAAMSSADYDGDQGRLGTTVGIKNADPTAKMAIGGLAGIDIEYWKNMKLWADYNRGGSFPGDAINVHWYSSNGSNQGGNATSGISPEADDLKGRLQQLTEWRDNNLPNVEVWISEFGYDTSQDSPLRAPTIGPFSPAEVQGQWLVRGYLALAAAGVDRAQMYMFRDVASGDTGGIFGTSGLVTEKGSWTPKISWYYVSTLTKRLKGMRFDSVMNSGNANVYVYKFKLPNSAKTAYAVWCPTSNNTTVSNYQLAVGSSGVSGVKRIDLTSGQANGVETPLTVTGGNVTLNVSERPTLVITDNAVPNATEVKITSPADGAKFTTTDTINITAEVAYNNNPITQVAFYRGSTLIGTDNVAPWSASASNLPAGVYDLKAVATDSTNATFNSPLIRIVVPSGTGLTGKYYNGSTFNTLVKTQIDPTINFDWGWGNYGDWDQSLDHNAFSVRWTGQIQALETGTYNIGSNYDDAIRVTINIGTNRKVIDQWTAGGSMYFVKSGPIYLIGGQKYDITVDYAQRATNGNGGLAAIDMKWIRPGQTAFEVVPSSQLYPTISGGSSGTGTGLTGQYYSGTGFNTLVNTRVDPTVDFDWGSGSAMTSVGPDNFSVRWTGQVETVEAGTYSFTTTTDDGAKLWVNNQLLVDKWVPQGSTAWSGTITLSANQKYDIKMEYFENGGQALAQLKWLRPGQSTAVVIPQTQLYPTSGVTPTPTPTVAPTATPTPTPTATPTPTPTPSPGTGLKGQYYNDMTLTNLITTRTDSTVYFDWGYGSPVAGVGSNNFSARWSGQVKAVESGSYSFTTNTDDGVKLWVNNQLLIDKWVPQAPILWSGNVSLTAGQKYDIKMEYYEDGGGALAQLQWLRPGQSTATVIPQAQLYPAP